MNAFMDFLLIREMKYFVVSQIKWFKILLRSFPLILKEMSLLWDSWMDSDDLKVPPRLPSVTL